MYLFKSTIAFAFLGIILLTEAAEIQQRNLKENSPNNYVYKLANASYNIYTEPKTWNEARKACEKDGAHLAIINSESEAKLFNDMILKSKSNLKDALYDNEVWIGIHDQFENGDWLTIFGEPLESTGYVDWIIISDSQNPDNLFGKESCGAIVSSLTVGLNDLPCYNELAYICEFNPPEDKSLGCSENDVAETEALKKSLEYIQNELKLKEEKWTAEKMHLEEQCAQSKVPQNPNASDYNYRLGNSSYKVCKEYQTWNEAKKNCEKDGAQLAMIDSKDEAKFYNKMITESMDAPDPNNCTVNWLWLGITNDDNNSFQRSGNNCSMRSIFGKSDENDKNNCPILLLTSERVGMSDANCDEKYPYICEIQLNK